MAVVTGLTKARMEAIEAASVVDGDIVGDNLILTTHGGTQINAGNVRGPVGPSGGSFLACTHATRPSWSSGDAGKAIYETDTKLWYIWNGTSFRCQEQIVCTSTTRPTTLVSADAGVKIFETDTGMDYFWTGTSFFPAGSYIARFADAAARSSAWPSPGVGALSYLNNAPGVLWVFESGVWNSAGPPPGTAFPTILSSPPLCHEFMYGQTLANAQTLYPVLWANVPSTWKSGSSLIVPDMRGRIPVGLDNMGGSDAGRLSVANTLGLTGGEEKHTLSISEMPSHFHYTNANTGYTGGVTAGSDFSVPGYGGNSEAAGGGTSHNNMQPYILLNWALKIL